MALLIDGPVASIDDLRRYDSYALDVSSAEKIDLSSKLEIAQRELKLQISAFLLRAGTTASTSRALSQVIVTEPLLHAVCVHALELVYRDAYNSQLNDRYSGKWKQYQQLWAEALDLLFQIGIGINPAALPKAAVPYCTTVPGGLNDSAIYQIAIAYQGLDAGASALSEPLVISVPAGYVLQVRATDLPGSETGWHLYLGRETGSLTRQTALQLGHSDTWTQISSVLRTDLPTIPEQTPSRFVIESRRLSRG